MQDQERGPSRCRVLRQNMKDIDIQLRKYYNDERQARSQLDKLRSEISVVIDEITRLDILFAAAAVASGGRSLVSTGIGLVGSDISGKRSLLKRKREILKSDIKYIIPEIKRLRDNINRFIRSRDISGEEMNELNCA